MTTPKPSMSKEPAMCPHGRPEGQMCPHCLGINTPTPPKIEKLNEALLTQETKQ